MSSGPQVAEATREDRSSDDEAVDSSEAEDGSNIPRSYATQSVSHTAQSQQLDTSLTTYATGSASPASHRPPTLQNLQLQQPQQHASRSGTGNHPLSELSSELAGFCSFAVDQIASCVTFCAQKPALWKDVDLLPSIAQKLLRRGEDDKAQQVVQRFVMLKQSGKEGSIHRVRMEWLAKANNDPAAKTKFLGMCEQTYERLQAGISQPGASSTSSSRDSGTASRHHRVVSSPSSTPALNRRYSNQSTSLASRPARSAQPETETDFVSALPNLPLYQSTRAPTVLSDNVDDVDSVLGGPKMIGQSGPLTSIVATWPPQVRDTLSKDCILYEGKKDIDRVFCVGSLIAVYWHENVGSSLSKKYSKVPHKPEPKVASNITEGPRGTKIYSHPKRFVICRQRDGHSVACPVTSYSNQGTGAKQLSSREHRAHVIIYAEGTKATPAKGETPFTRPSICVKMHVAGDDLWPTSRLYYAKPQSIDHNIKVKHLGQVIKTHIDRLLGAYADEMSRVD